MLRLTIVFLLCAIVSVVISKPHIGPCNLPTCRMACFEYEKDSEGCAICKCKQVGPPSRCPPNKCENLCLDGYESDSNGCATSCRCNIPEYRTCDTLNCRWLNAMRVRPTVIIRPDETATNIKVETNGSTVLNRPNETSENIKVETNGSTKSKRPDDSSEKIKVETDGGSSVKVVVNH